MYSIRLELRDDTDDERLVEAAIFVVANEKDAHYCFDIAVEQITVTQTYLEYQERVRNTP